MIEIRQTEPAEYRAASAVLSTALLHAPANDEDWAKSEPTWVDSDSLSAWDGDRCVGHTGGYRFDTVIPGGARLATSGVTRVGVLGTHRRRGLLRTMMTRLLEEAHQRGQVLASLRASETLIYQRYGFGLAGECAEISVVPATARPISGAAGGSMRLMQPDEIIDTVKPIYDAVATRPGVISRPDWMWQRYLKDAVELGGDASFVAVHSSVTGDVDGFVHYGVKWKTDRYSPPSGDGEIYELWGADAAVELALWEYVGNVDLIDEWYAEERPVDDAVQFAVADRRAYRSKWRWDEQWLRLLDVDAALAARTYAEAAGSITVSVSDDMFEHNEGIWEISSAGAKRIDDGTDADLQLDVGSLAAVYLGGTKWSALAAVGRIRGVRPECSSIADALFSVPLAPFCGSGF